MSPLSTEDSFLREDGKTTKGILRGSFSFGNFLSSFDDRFFSHLKDLKGLKEFREQISCYIRYLSTDIVAVRRRIVAVRRRTVVDRPGIVADLPGLSPKNEGIVADRRELSPKDEGMGLVAVRRMVFRVSEREAIVYRRHPLEKSGGFFGVSPQENLPWGSLRLYCPPVCLRMGPHFPRSGGAVPPPPSQIPPGKRANLKLLPVTHSLSSCAENPSTIFKCRRGADSNLNLPFSPAGSHSEGGTASPDRGKCGHILRQTGGQ